jgi:hypothetical protein
MTMRDWAGFGGPIRWVKLVKSTPLDATHPDKSKIAPNATAT